MTTRDEDAIERREREIEELSEAFSPATIAGLAQRLYELRRELRRLKGEEETVARILREHIARTGEPVCAEGVPPLELRDVGAGWYWDSSAIRAIQERWPEEWRRLVDLGAALAHDQLVRRPEGGIERRQTSKDWIAPGEAILRGGRLA